MRRYEAKRLVRDGEVTWERLSLCLGEISMRPGNAQSKINPALTIHHFMKIMGPLPEKRSGVVKTVGDELIAINILREYGSVRQYEALIKEDSECPATDPN